MKKLVLIVAAFAFGVGMHAQDCSDLFISEYIEGTGNSKAVEIYNPTGSIINLGSYLVARYSNGNFSYESGGITQLQGFLQPYSTHLLVNGQTVSTETSPACDPALQALAQQLDGEYPVPTYMNGNDAIALFKDPVGAGNVNDFIVLDLFGIIGGGMQSSDVGWASFTNEWVYKNIYEGDEIVGQDSVFIQNYIVPAGYYWIPWSKDHSLVRKKGVLQGVKANPQTEFVITTEWDTVPGGANAWDSLGMHICDCDPSTSIGPSYKSVDITVYPNPVSNSLNISAAEPFSEVILLDASARVIFRETFEGAELERMVNIPDMNPGIYFLKVQMTDEAVTRKIVIN